MNRQAEAIGGSLGGCDRCQNHGTEGRLKCGGGGGCERVLHHATCQLRWPLVSMCSHVLALRLGIRVCAASGRFTYEAGIAESRQPFCEEPPLLTQTSKCYINSHGCNGLPLNYQSRRAALLARCLMLHTIVSSNDFPILPKHNFLRL